MKDSRGLSRYVMADPESASVDRIWHGVREALPAGARRKQSRRRMAFGVFAVALAIIVAGVALRGSRLPPSALDGAVLETTVGQQQTLVLSDGSQILLEPSTTVALIHVAGRDVRLELRRGTVRLDVAHVSGRRFVVAVADVEVEDIGTRFDTTFSPEDNEVRVHVALGNVRVTRPKDPKFLRVLSASETWAAYVKEIPAVPPALLPLHVLAEDAGHSSAPPRTSHLPSKFHEDFAADRFSDAFALAEPNFLKLVKVADADELYQLAQAARFAGHPRDAAIAFDEFREEHPRDGRAAFASFEVGRLRLQLDEPAAAKAALEDALRLAPQDQLGAQGALSREDAEARLVEALDRLGDRTACAAARKRYLEQYPQSVHYLTVSRRCP